MCLNLLTLIGNHRLRHFFNEVINKYVEKRWNKCTEALKIWFNSQRQDVRGLVPFMKPILQHVEFVAMLTAHIAISGALKLALPFIFFVIHVSRKSRLYCGNRVSRPHSFPHQWIIWWWIFYKLLLSPDSNLILSVVTCKKSNTWNKGNLLPNLSDRWKRWHISLLFKH